MLTQFEMISRASVAAWLRLSSFFLASPTASWYRSSLEDIVKARQSYCLCNCAAVTGLVREARHVSVRNNDNVTSYAEY